MTYETMLSTNTWYHLLPCPSPEEAAKLYHTGFEYSLFYGKSPEGGKDWRCVVYYTLDNGESKEIWSSYADTPEKALSHGLGKLPIVLQIWRDKRAVARFNSKIAA